VEQVQFARVPRVGEHHGAKRTGVRGHMRLAWRGGKSIRAYGRGREGGASRSARGAGVGVRARARTQGCSGRRLVF